nr:DNA cytosine methyltransferase [Canibacter zhuwentaonis]
MGELQVVDLFSGCGGLSLGFQNAGFNVIAAFDNWRPAIEVYKLNFEHPIIEQDLNDVEEAVTKIVGFEPDIIVGGAPCQDFSTAGHQDESKGRAVLSVRFAEAVVAVRPKYFVMENVATIRNTESFAAVIKLLSRAGYGLTQRVLDASYCGVPQRRKRMFLIGAQDAQDGFLESYLDAAMSPVPMSIRDYLGDSLGIDHYFRVPTNYSRRAVFSIDEPSMTIRAVDRPIPSGYKGNPNDSAPVSEVRGLTPRERSLIQTFPETFNFVGSKGDINAMVGNAVPVNLASFVARALGRYISDEETDETTSS